MPVPIYLGDEAGAAGYRLAGVETRIPAQGDEMAALQEARARAPLVLVSAAVAAHIDSRALREALAALTPLVAVVPDTQAEVARPDLVARLRGQLGLPG
ncbi:MAG: Vacuolar H+transporting two-sector ATPase F subunit [Betaproteobacteria bacterium]|nr:Vacuolar H+transporting two-sector ATPase F subunit [Betaproteobacteria bacterium]MDE2360038.1 Vacuolar H+transporting two-sector ATPase F subunit [Betaproteobacteria bacterium]